MKFCPEMLNEIVESMGNGELIYPHSIIIGDNASGKSELIRRLVEKKIQAGERIYFIDSVNRYFDVLQVSDSDVEILQEAAVVEKRLDPEHFNIVDSFSLYGTETERVEWLYRKYELQVQKLLWEFCQITFVIEHKKERMVKYEEQQEGKLSNGIQALVRIFLELLYVKEAADGKEMLVVIDELDEFLSPSNASKIFPFLLEKFPMIKFIISTHSADLVRTAQTCNLIILQDATYEVVDGEDFDSFGEVKYIFDKVFSNNMNRNGNKNPVEDKLRSLLNKRMMGAWGELEERDLAELKKKGLTNAQKILFKRIEEW